MTSLESNLGCHDGDVDEFGNAKKARWELLVREMSQLPGAPSVDHFDDHSCPSAIFQEEYRSDVELDPGSFPQAG